VTLSLVAPIVDDEPVARASKTAADKFDCRAVNRRAVALWPHLRAHIVGIKGQPLGDVLRLNPNYVERDPGRARPAGGPQLKEFRGPGSDERDGGPGAWRDIGTGEGGPDLVSLIQYLSNGCERRVAADFLKSLCDRMVVIP
jgi:hypothetical protein